MIRIYQEFDTEKEAEDFRDRMYRSFHPAGYGTHIRIEHIAEKNKYVAYGSRSHSCD